MRVLRKKPMLSILPYSEDGEIMSISRFGDHPLDKGVRLRTPFSVPLEDGLQLKIKRHDSGAVLIQDEIYQVRTSWGVTLCYLLITRGPYRYGSIAITVFKFADGTKHMICEPYSGDHIKIHREYVRKYLFRQVFGNEEGE